MVERLKFHLITCIALLYLTTGNMCMPVQAADLEPRESTGEEEILYRVDTLFDGVFGIRLVVFGYLSIYVISALGVVVWKLKGRFGKNSALT